MSALGRASAVMATLLMVLFITFCLAHLSPGDPLGLNPQLNTSDLGQQRGALGLDDPLVIQFGRWLGRVGRGDWGRSLVDQQPVSLKMAQALPVTLTLSATALVGAIALALPFGVVLATSARRRWAKVAELVLVAGWAVPSFWLALLVLTVFAGPRFVSLFPLQGGLVLPAFCLAWPHWVQFTRQVRSGVEGALAQQFIVAARARGLSERRVVWRHAVPNALAPVLTLVGLQLPSLVGGSVVVEQIFGLPGMGQLMWTAVGTRDYPTILGATTLMALVTLCAWWAVDLLIQTLDPRFRDRP